MKAASVDYVRVTTVAEAVSALALPGAKVLAGGQSLVPMLNLRLAAPELLVDITGIASLRAITVDGAVLRIGALVLHAALLASPLIEQHAPLLHRAARFVAHAAIRNCGTFGGSLAHADPAAEFPACALALGARIIAEGPAGRRVIPAEGFFTGLFETALAADEVLTAVEVDCAGDQAVWGFQELSRRSGDYAMVGLAAFQRNGGAVRLGWFSVGATCRLAPRAAEALGRGNLQDALLVLADDLPAYEDNQADAATRMKLARVLLRRVAQEMGL